MEWDKWWRGVCWFHSYSLSKASPSVAAYNAVQKQLGFEQRDVRYCGSLGERLYWLGWLGISLVVVANLLRRLPWQQWTTARALITPHPSELVLDGGGLQAKRVPLLGTPQTPGWLKGALCAGVQAPRAQGPG